MIDFFSTNAKTILVLGRGEDAFWIKTEKYHLSRNRILLIILSNDKNSIN